MACSGHLIRRISWDIFVEKARVQGVLWLSRINSSKLNKGSPGSAESQAKVASMGEQMFMKTLGHRKKTYRRWKQYCETWKGYIETLYIQG